jgi:hypothetical protein
MSQSRRRWLYYSIALGLPPLGALISSLAFLKVVPEYFGIAFMGTGLWSVVFGIGAFRLREPPRPLWKSVFAGLLLFSGYNAVLWSLSFWILRLFFHSGHT